MTAVGTHPLRGWKSSLLCYVLKTVEWGQRAGDDHSTYIRITRSMARAQTAQKVFGLRLNMMQSTSGR